ncbi:hypothetical protein U1Q18_011657 [Sarracenia purpurea var. burkii]
MQVVRLTIKPPRGSSLGFVSADKVDLAQGYIISPEQSSPAGSTDPQPSSAGSASRSGEGFNDPERRSDLDQGPD